MSEEAVVVWVTIVSFWVLLFYSLTAMFVWPHARPVFPFGVLLLCILFPPFFPFLLFILLLRLLYGEPTRVVIVEPAADTRRAGRTMSVHQFSGNRV